MFGLNGFAFICFSAVNIIAVYLCRLSYHKRRLVLSMLSLLLLSVRLLFLFQDREVLQRIPVEFSAVAYFAVPLIILSGSRKLLPWASYSGLIAGFFYYATMIIAGGKIYAEYSVNEIYLSLFSHGVLFICGFSLAATEHFEKRNVFPFPLYCAAIGTHAVLWRPFVGINGRVFIYELLDAVWVKSLFSPGMQRVAIPVFYIVLGAAVLFTIYLFTYINESLPGRFAVSSRSTVSESLVHG